MSGRATQPSRTAARLAWAIWLIWIPWLGALWTVADGRHGLSALREIALPLLAISWLATGVAAFVTEIAFRSRLLEMHSHVARERGITSRELAGMQLVWALGAELPWLVAAAWDRELRQDPIAREWGARLNALVAAPLLVFAYGVWLSAT